MTSKLRREIRPEFKQEAAELLASSGRTIRQIAGDLYLGLSTLNRWKREQRNTEPVTKPNPDMAKELARLRKENEILRYDNAVVETVFKTIKTELILRASYETRACRPQPYTSATICSGTLCRTSRYQPWSARRSCCGNPRSVRYACAWAHVVAGPEEMTAMNEEIEQGGVHLGVAKDSGPFAEAEVGGDDDAGAFLELAQQMEQQRPT